MTSSRCLSSLTVVSTLCLADGLVTPAPGMYVHAGQQDVLVSPSCAKSPAVARQMSRSSRSKTCRLNAFPDWKEFEKWAEKSTSTGTQGHNIQQQQQQQQQQPVTRYDFGHGHNNKGDEYQHQQKPPPLQTSMNQESNAVREENATIEQEGIMANYTASSLDEFNLTNTSSSTAVHESNKSRSNDWIGAWGMRREDGKGDKDIAKKKETKDATRSKKMSPKSGSASISLPPGRDPTAPLTISDLERILEHNGYVRKSDLRSSRGENVESGRHLESTKSSSGATSKGSNVAFPQPSILSYHDVQIGATLVSALCGLVLSASVIRNLWLVGLVVGGVYGHSVSQDVNDPDLGPVAQILINYGRRAAKKYLQIYDFCQGMWFMYKTGQLSYSYYKQYESLDRKFGLQEKMDAWNARFVEGKRNFDRWEQENEIGRKVLATLRTAWMVEEQSYRKQLKRRKGSQSKYAVIAYIQNFFAWIRRLWNVVAGNLAQGEMRDFLKGVKVQLSELNTKVVIQRAGSAVTLLVLINAIGALFATAPGVLSSAAIISGILWPDWLGETFERMFNIVEETRARGRGEVAEEESSSLSLSQKRPSPTSTQPRFHYFERSDGTKRYYRTGKPLLIFRKLNNEDGSGKSGQQSNFLLSINPFSNGRQEQEKTIKSAVKGPFAFLRR